ncbi:SIMPL domain-containing protein [Dehalogenimonas sp. THU2]|uniref:SIMPL domain-containing protein n=1 Tax=Dehalogenimonas sp. THU2 TaxID=3151121 RepID=UPI003218D2D8
MKRGITILVSAILIVALGIGATGWAAAQSGEVINTTQQVGIWVNGTGKVTATPDTANLSLGVQVEAATITEANQKAAAAMESLIATLKGQSVADKDIKTQYFNVYPVYDYDRDTGKSTIRGYQVSNNVEVKVRVIANAGPIIDAVVAVAGDVIRVNNIYFTIENTTALEAQARELALLDAKAKAEQIANVTGVSLGQISFVSDSSSGSGRIAMPTPSFDAKAGAESSVTPILPGETDIFIQVQVIFNIN